MGIGDALPCAVHCGRTRMTRPSDTERMETKPDEQAVSSDTQRMKPLDPSNVEPPIIRHFKYDTDHNGPATEDTELIRGINRARDRIDERKADLDAALKTPTPPPSDPGPASETNSTSRSSRDLGWRFVPLPKTKTGWMYFLYGTIAAAILLAIFGLVINATKPAVGAPTISNAVGPRIPITPVSATSNASAVTSAPLPTPVHQAPPTTTTTSRPAMTSKPLPTATQTQPVPIATVANPQPTTDPHVPIDNL